MFDKNSVYLPTKKIGKNNPKAAEIEADNTARQEWNRTADLALISGIEEAKILEIKQTEIHDKAGQSIRENGWLPNLFRGIVGKAKEFLQAIIREKDMPPKPVLNMDMDEFRTMQTLMLKVQKQAKAIKKIQEVTLPNLRQQLAETTGIFKGKERKALEKQIQQIEAAARDIGLAFQIRDDILDVTSTVDELGKPVFSDEKNEKMTYVTIEGIEKAKKDVEEISKRAICALKSMEKENEFLEELVISLVDRKK